MDLEHLSKRGGALLIDKPAGITSFGVVEALQRRLREGKPGVKRKNLPKLGHGGTLDPFATGLLVVCVGKAVKLAQYFLGSSKGYSGTIRFGETTVPGDPTEAISERSDRIPADLEAMRELARKLTLQPYLQTPPMHSAKKKDGKPLYELARLGIEVEREAKLLYLHQFRITGYEPPRATFELECSSGTYVRTLAQDFARMQDTVALLETLHRTRSGTFHVDRAWSLSDVLASDEDWDGLPCWVPFDLLLEDAPRAEATEAEAQQLVQGQQGALHDIMARSASRLNGMQAASREELRADEEEPPVAIYSRSSLVAIARRRNHLWELERVFT
jgi:tRNA pseudouridine55 synthase